MLRKFIFKDSSDQKELQLPIAPPSFKVDHGINIETINICNLGDVSLPGKIATSNITINCMFPANEYPYVGSGVVLDPYQYVQQFIHWNEAGKVVRFMISGTPLNKTVIIENISYGEQDGTNDVYATITLRDYKELKPVQVNFGKITLNKFRTAETVKTADRTYKVKKGDTLSAICRQFYGNVSLYPKLAKFNNIKNANLIQVGKVLKIPDKAKL